MRFISALLLSSVFAHAMAADIYTALYVTHLKKADETSNTVHVTGKLYSVYSTAAVGDACTAELEFVNNVTPIPISFSPVAGAAKPVYAPTPVAGPGYCTSVVDIAGDFFSRVDFHNFPFDYQKFEVILASPASVADFALRPRAAGLTNPALHINGWRDVSSSVTTNEVTNSVTGVISHQVIFEKTVRREFTFFLSKYISNVILLVIMSLFTVLFPVKSVMRIVLVLMSFVAIILWQYAIAHKLPSAAYPNKYDAFVHISFSVLFAQFLYYTVHKAFYSRSQVPNTLNVDSIKPVGETADAIHEDASIYISSSTSGIPSQDNYVTATLGSLEPARKVDIIVTGVLSVYYFIAVASVLGLGSDLTA